MAANKDQKGPPTPRPSTPPRRGDGDFEAGRPSAVTRRPTVETPVAKASPAPASPTPTGEHPIAGVKKISLEGFQVPANGATATAPAAPRQPQGLTDHQKSQLGSVFGSGRVERQRASMLGTSTDPGSRKAVIEEPAEPDYEPDGTTPHPAVTQRDLWKAVKAPLSSREGARSRERYEQVVAQFAVGHNPRYAEDAPGKPRGHIFVWDVSRAMQCEIPHFVGAKELTLVQTCDWLRHEGPMRGWLKIGTDDAFAMADKGLLVVAMPKELRLRHMAIVLPQDEAMHPLLTGAGLSIGVNVPPMKMVGANLLECFYHP